jgi:hypothetical protein
MTALHLQDMDPLQKVSSFFVPIIFQASSIVFYAADRSDLDTPDANIELKLKKLDER